MGLVAALQIAGPASAQDATGPTPYPKEARDWPGKGVIRVFGWMTDNRKYFWQNREKNQGAVVFAGDSLTGNWDTLAKAFPKLKVANRGIGGDVSRGLLFRFKEDVLDLHPKAIVILIGTNDLTAKGSTADAESNIATMLEMAEKEMPPPPVILCTTPPSDNPKAPVDLAQRQDLNARITKLAEGKTHVTLLDLYSVFANPDGSPKPENFKPDRLHFAAPGYEKWTAALSPVLARLGIE